MIKPILLKRLPFTAEQMLRVTDNYLNEAAKNIKIDFGVTTQTWRSRPDFVISMPQRYSRWIYTSNKIYYFVSGGTSKRYAVMSRGFRAKTVVRRIGSRAGKGGMVWILPKAGGKWMPGIKAREFPDTIVSKQVRQFQRMWNTAVEAQLRYGY